MKKYFLSFFMLIVLIVSLFSQPGLTQELAPSKVLIAVSDVMAKSPQNSTLLLQAQEEASAFSFSDGTLRGRKLSKALQLVRTENPRLRASDMEIAIALLQAN